MALVIELPVGPEREWRGIESDFRATYADMPDGLGCIEECLPRIRDHFNTLYPAFAVNSRVELPADTPANLHHTVELAIHDAVSQVVVQLRKERAHSLAALAAVEYKAAYYRRNPSAA